MGCPGLRNPPHGCLEFLKNPAGGRLSGAFAQLESATELHQSFTERVAVAYLGGT